MTDCSCAKCVECCERRPGWFKPGEAERAAELLNLTLQDFFDQYLVIDYWVGTEENILLLQPRQIGNSRKRLNFTDAFRESPCIFLEQGLCKIHEAKPFECKATMGCVEKVKPTGWHETAAMAWDNPEAQQQIEELDPKE